MKTKIEGLTEKNIYDLGCWYAYFTGKLDTTYQTKPMGSYKTGINGTTQSKSISPRITKRTVKLGCRNFEKVLRLCHPFDLDIQLTPVKDNQFGMKFKSTDKDGQDVLVDFTYGDIIDIPTTVKVMDGERADLLFYSFKNFHKMSREMTIEEMEEYARVFAEEKGNHSFK